MRNLSIPEAHFLQVLKPYGLEAVESAFCLAGDEERTRRVFGLQKVTEASEAECRVSEFYNVVQKRKARGAFGFLHSSGLCSRSDYPRSCLFGEFDAMARVRVSILFTLPA